MRRRKFRRLRAQLRSLAEEAFLDGNHLEYGGLAAYLGRYGIELTHRAERRIYRRHFERGRRDLRH